jgi:hypothetical protein
MVGINLGSEDAAGFVGAWLREPGRSDMHAYSKQLDIMNVRGIKKFAALNLFKGLQIHTDNVGGMYSHASQSEMSICFNLRNFQLSNTVELSII